MKTRLLISIGLGAAVLTAGAGIAVPSIVSAAAAENPARAASEARAARSALAKRKADKAVQHAEAAVAYAPNVAEYRGLLGQAYLLSGRFASAREALTDALTLDPGNPGYALNLSLAQIAQGDWAGARNTLSDHEDINPSDRGLAFALAGDPVRAIEILTPAARAADATPKTRQNLALSLALAGRWQEAKAIAAMDMSAAQVDARIMEWAAFSRPTNAYDQVASLLGVRAVQDPGQPTALALVIRPNTALAALEPAPAPAADPVDAYMPSAPANAEAVAQQVSEETGVQIAEVEQAPQETAIAGTSSRVVFGPRAEIVQAIPAASAVSRNVATRTAPRARVDTPRTSYARGNYYVQLGAFENSAVARDAWRRTSARVPALAGQTPQGAQVTTAQGRFYRLSVGGFARADADAMCRTVRASGGRCFVRVQAGDQTAAWVRPGAQVASR